MLADVVDLLRCPHCGAGLALEGAAVRCPAGHSFDVARQGYVTLATGPGDDGEMVVAREKFLQAGHFEPVATALAERVDSGPVVDLGSGPGDYLARVLGADRAGLALDSSPYALRRAARVHPRVGAVGCDVWRELPVRGEVAGTVIDVFSPRNGAEIARILRPGGTLVVVTPAQRHLAQLVDAFGLLMVDPSKQERLDAQLAPHLQRVDTTPLEFELTLAPEDATALVAMGPSAHHGGAQVREPIAVTASVELSVWRRL